VRETTGGGSDFSFKCVMVPKSSFVKVHGTYNSRILSTPLALFSWMKFFFRVCERERERKIIIIIIIIINTNQVVRSFSDTKVGYAFLWELIEHTVLVDPISVLC
jgi:hypothetical protein